MDPELMALASSAATTLVGLMVSDVWTEVKDAVARTLARDKSTEQVAYDLENSRTELLRADRSEIEQLTAAVEGEWRVRVRDLLQAEPALAEELRHLTRAWSTPRARHRSEVNNTITGGVQNGPVIQAGRISGLTLHLPTAAPDGDEG